MPYFRRAVDAMAGYTPGEQPQGGGYIKLNTNENPYPPSPRVAEAVERELASLARYPEPTNRVVREAAAEVYGLPPEQFMAVNGSDEILRVLFQSCVSEGDEVASFYPTYSLYASLAEIQGARMRWIPFPEDFSLPPLPKLAPARLVILANPNAPSGTLVPLDTIELLCRAASDTLVVVDEAYADFAGTTAIPLIARHPNLVVCRTFSKSYSLAGLRAGLAFARREVQEALAKVRDSYNLDRLTQAGAAAALRDQAHMLTNVSRIVATRGRLTLGLQRLGAHVWPSSTNFVLARFKRPAARDIYAALKERKILVRYFDAPRLDDCLRISVGLDAEIDAFLAALAEIIGGGS